MANRRMWLVHKPTGAKALLAKHWTDGWRKFEGVRHEPYYSIQGLLDATPQNNEDFEIVYDD